MLDAVLHGYYRATDINWEWQKVLPDEDVTPFKSFIHSECITSPEHPFYNASLGGVELFIGVLPDNESRLLFSSKQIEYLRYWLKAMGLMDHLLPLPHSDNLLTKDMLRSVAPVIIKTGAEMKQQQKKIDKLNKRLRGAVDEKLAAIRQIFERVRAAYGTCKGTWIAADFEAWERDHTVITEFGFAELKWSPVSDTQEFLVDGNPQSPGPTSVKPPTTTSEKFQPVITRTGHWILKENQYYRNGEFCQDNRDRFSYGQSEVLPRSDFIRRIQELVKPEACDEPLFLVFHDHSQDLKYLVEPKYRLEILDKAPTLVLPDAPPTNGTYVIDTAQLFGALEGDGDERRSLENVYRKLTHRNRFDYHNAGNDARYTLEVLQEMATGGPLDAQRERRWPPPPPEPGQPVKKTVKVEDWAPEDSSDYEDMETIMGGWGEAIPKVTGVLPAEETAPILESSGTSATDQSMTEMAAT